MEKIRIHDKEFRIFLSCTEIEAAVEQIANQINTELSGKDVIFIGILNGAFMFASDLYKKIRFNSRITFLKLASYQGDKSEGNVKRLIGINEDIKNKTVVVLEDIVDTGNTIEDIDRQLSGYEPAEIKIATMFFKPEQYKKDMKLDYIGLEIPSEFIIGYGLDYNGYGRNLNDLYIINN